MKHIHFDPEPDGFYGAYWPCQGADCAVIAMLGDDPEDHMARSAVKWLLGQGVSVLTMSPAKKDYSHHNYPLERVEAAIAWLTAHGNRKVGIAGASTTGTLALTAASYFPALTLTIAMTASDFVWQGFAAEGKRTGDRMNSRKIFDDSEAAHPLQEEMIPVERIPGKLLLVGAEDDTLWDAARYIRRMGKRLSEKPHSCSVEAAVYAHGTHFVFPEEMLKTMLPVGSALFVKWAFPAARKYPRECRETRLDVERRVCRALTEWKGEK